MRKISICKTKFLPFDFTLVDDEDFEQLNKWRWHTDNKGYVCRRVRADGKKLVVYMHREIMLTPDNLVTDHINGIVTDNRKHNLRICTDGENKRNRGKTKANPTEYKGAYWQTQIKRWYSRIQLDGKSTYLGTFNTAKEAAQAYNQAAVEYHGKFAKLNIIKE